MKQNNQGKLKGRKKLFIYKDKDGEFEVFRRKLLSEVEKEKGLEYFTNIPFHPLALNDFLKNHNKSYGERFELCFRFFRYSVED